MLLLYCCGTTGETLAEPLLRRCNWTTFFGLPRPLAASPRPLLTSFGRGWHRSSLGDVLIFVSKFWVGIAFGATKECVDRRVAPPDINDPRRWPTSQRSWLSAGTARRWWWGFASQSLYCTISLKAVCSSKLYNRRSLGILLNDFQLCQLLYFFIISVCLCVFRSWHRQCPDCGSTWGIFWERKCLLITLHSRLMLNVTDTNWLLLDSLMEGQVSEVICR